MARCVGALCISLFLVLFVSIGYVLADDDNVKPKEIGAIWQNSYGNSATPDSCAYSILEQTDDFCNNLKNVLVKKGGWSVHGGVWEGDTAEASDIEKTGNDKADYVDLFVWAGHGPETGSDGSHALHFRNNHPLDECSDACNVEHSECSWGEGDCEVVVTYTCNFLTDEGDPDMLESIKKMCQKVHVICGAVSVIQIIGEQGTDFGIYLMGKRGWFVIDVDPQPITRAWFMSFQPYSLQQGRDVAVIYHSSTKYDYLKGNLDWAEGKQMTDDPTPCTDSNLGDYVKTTYHIGNPLPL